MDHNLGSEPASRTTRSPANRCARLAAVVGSACLTGCVGIQVDTLNPDLTVKGKDTGVVYYLPSPYLLVAELPPSAAASTSTPGPAHEVAPQNNPANLQNNPAEQQPPGGSPAPAPGSPRSKPGGKAKAKGTPKAETATPPTGSVTPGDPSTGGDQSDKSAKTDQTKTGSSDPSNSPAPISDVSFSASTSQYVFKLVYLPDLSHPMAVKSKGSFGTSSLKPTLQDGWMLTNLDVQTDSKTPETLTALGGVVGAALGKGGGSTTPSSKPGGAAQPSRPADLSSYYTPSGSILRPGLYRFDYDQSSGALVGMTSVAFFTGCGTVSPAGARTTSSTTTVFPSTFESAVTEALAKACKANSTASAPAASAPPPAAH